MMTVVEVMDRIMPVEDEEISTLARTAHGRSRSMKILTGATGDWPEQGFKDNVTATIDDGKGGNFKEITVDRVISAVGIVQGNIEDIGFENTKVKTDRGIIVADGNEWSETDEPGVYAIGDVAGPAHGSPTRRSMRA